MSAPPSGVSPAVARLKAGLHVVGAGLATACDYVMDWTVAPGFSAVGYRVRKSTHRSWRLLDSYSYVLSVCLPAPLWRCWPWFPHRLHHHNLL